MLSSTSIEQFSVKEIVYYDCVKTIGPKSVELLCSALKDHLLEKGADLKSENNRLAHGVHVRLFLEIITSNSIQGWMEWTRCTDAKCGYWTKTETIKTIVTDSKVRSSTYREFIIGLFISANNSKTVRKK